MAILLCNLKKTTCRDVRAGCSLRRPSPARKQVVDKDPCLHKSDSRFRSEDLRNWILPYCSKPGELEFKLKNRNSNKKFSRKKVLFPLFFLLFFRNCRKCTYHSGIFLDCHCAWRYCCKSWRHPDN